MIGPTGAVRVMVATKAVDFRKEEDEGLAALVREVMQAESWPRKSGQVDKWIFCLTPATLAENQEIR